MNSTKPPFSPDGAGRRHNDLLGLHAHERWEKLLMAGYQADARVWTAQRVQSCVDALDSRGHIIVLANREPIRHDRAPDGSIATSRSASGLVTGLEPLIQACSGVWVGHGAGSADRDVVDRRDGLNVPQAAPKYRLRRVWLNPREERGYYYGFANEGLWPLCHRTQVRPVFRSSDFAIYRRVNARFARAVCDEALSQSPLVLVQDYHFALAPAFIRRRLSRSTIVTFWHIPWPRPDEYGASPWARQLVEGLLGSDIIGFQTPQDCRNFTDTVENLCAARINRTRSIVAHAGRETLVRAYPISIEWPSRWVRESPAVGVCRQLVFRELALDPQIRLGVGVDRLDYTKGINEKFLAIAKLLESHPEFRERFVFVQIAEPSRNCLPAYCEIRSRLLETADRINLRFGTGRYRPIVVREAHHTPAEVFRFMRAADLCYVGSLHDGMNLVAKEFVAARDDNQGVLVLSRFTGAAHQLSDALIVNPYAIDEAAGTLAQALQMTGEEQAHRIRRLRAVVAEFNAFRWAGEMLADASRLRLNRVLSTEPAGRRPWAADALHA
jgi:trehalose 6-phosphate synthase